MNQLHSRCVIFSASPLRDKFCSTYLEFLPTKHEPPKSSVAIASNPMLYFYYIAVIMCVVQCCPFCVRVTTGKNNAAATLSSSSESRADQAWADRTNSDSFG